MLDQDPARRADFDREQAANRPLLSQITALVPDQSLKTPFSQGRRPFYKILQRNPPAPPPSGAPAGG